MSIPMLALAGQTDEGWHCVTPYHLSYCLYHFSYVWCVLLNTWDGHKMKVWKYTQADDTAISMAYCKTAVTPVH